MDIGYGMFALIEGPVKHKNTLCKELRSQVKWLFDYAQERGETILQKHQPPQKVADDIVGKGGYA
jgi:Icc-related predicted phosphoesterase